jgi:tetratricopeptide (TPR) repeat protein
MISLVAILGTLFAISLTAERNLANASAAVARDEAERAEAISDFLERILRSPNARWYVEGTAKGGDTPVRAVLNEASQQVDAEFADKPALRSDLHHILGDTYFGLGLLDEAERHHRMVLTLRQSIYDEPHPKIAEAYYYLSILVGARGDVVERVRLLRKSLEMLRRNNGVINFPFIANELAKLELDFGNLDTAQALANESLAFALKHFVEDSSGFGYRQRTLYVGSWYNARIEAIRGNDEVAIEWMAQRDSVEGFIKEIADGREAVLKQMASCETGLVLLNTNRFEEAEPFLLTCLSASEAQYPGHYLSSAPNVELRRLYELWDKPEKALVYEERARGYTAFADSIGEAIRQ